MVRSFVFASMTAVAVALLSLAAPAGAADGPTTKPASCCKEGAACCKDKKACCADEKKSCCTDTKACCDAKKDACDAK